MDWPNIETGGWFGLFDWSVTIKTMDHKHLSVAYSPPIVSFVLIAGADPSCLQEKEGLLSGQVAEPQLCTHTLTPTDNLEIPICHTCMFLKCKRKLEYLERSSAHTVRTCNLSTETHNFLIK